MLYHHYRLSIVDCIVSIVYLLFIFNQLIKQFMLIPVINRQIMKMFNFNELFLNIYS